MFKRFTLFLAFVKAFIFPAYAQFSGGSGTLEDPYKISNLTDLRYLSENDSYWNNHFVLTSDIDASDTRNWNVVNNKALGFSPIGNTILSSGDNAFTGSFLGNGHTISNLYINRNQGDIGLFGNLRDAKIERLSLQSPEIRGNLAVGTLVGLSNNSHISYCIVLSGSVEITGEYGGGLIGASDHDTIVGCIASVAVSGNAVLGGLAGALFETALSASCSIGEITGNRAIGGIAGLCIQAKIDDVYAVSRLTSNDLPTTGALIGVLNDSELNNGFFDSDVSTVNVAIGTDNAGQSGTALNTAGFNDQSVFEAAGWNFQDDWILTTIAGFDSNPRPYLRHQVFQHEIRVIVVPATAAVIAGNTFYNTGETVTLFADAGADFSFVGWADGETVISTANPYTFTCSGPAQLTALLKENIAFAGGSGTSTDPFQIENIDQLQRINSLPSLMSRHYLLMNDIDASATANWNGGKGFQPLGYENTHQKVPFTGSIDGGGHRIEYLHINRPDEDVVGLIRRALDANISDLGLFDCFIRGRDSVGAWFGQVLPVTGFEGTELSRVYVSGEVQGQDNVGAMAGYAESIYLDNTYNTARVVGRRRVGGLMGFCKRSSIIQVYSAGPVLAGAEAGALAGRYEDSNIGYSAFDHSKSVIEEAFGNNAPGNYISGGTDSFTDPFFTEFQMGLDLTNTWQYAYGHDGFKRPCLKWEKSYRLKTAMPTGGSANDPDRLTIAGRSSGKIFAKPDPGYRFVEWQDKSRVKINTGNPVTLEVVTSDTVISPLFVARSGAYDWNLHLTDHLAPLAGATLEMENSFYSSDKDGNLTIQNLDPGVYPFTVSASKYVTYHDTLRILNTSTADTIRLNRIPEPINTVTFIVKNGLVPIPNARIALATLASPSDTLFAVTDENGQARFNNLLLVTARYKVTANGFQAFTGEFTHATSDDRAFTVQLISLHDVTFNIISDTGQPVEGAEMILDGKTYRSNSLGEIAITGFASGDYNYWINAEGFSTFNGAFSFDGADYTEQIILPTPGEPIYEVKLVLQHGPWRVPDAGILFDGEAYTSDANGELLINMPSGNYDFFIITTGYDTYTAVAAVNGTDVTLTVELSPRIVSSFDVSVTDRNLVPIPGATVDYGGFMGVTDDNGIVRIENIAAERFFEISISAPGFKGQRHRMYVNENEIRQHFLLHPEFGLTLIVDDGSQALAGAKIDFKGTTYTTDAAGEVQITGLINGSYRYAVSHPGYETQTGTINIAGADLTETITLNKATISTYTLTFSVGDGTNDLAGAAVSVEGTTYMTGPDGKVQVTGLADGNYQYTVSYTGYQPEAGTINIAGADVTSAITLKKTAPLTHTLTFSVSDGTAPLAEVVIDFDGSRYSTDTSGKIEITALANGTYPYTASLPGYETISGTVEITGADQDIALVLEELITGISARNALELHIYPVPFSDFVFVALKNGHAISAVELHDAAGRSLRHFSHPGKGALSLADINAGTYFMVVSDVNGNLYRKRVIKK
ncbi:MAG: T9SS type A sorting domain-containing protein [Cytophagales bacterium]|nr:T9SS type A sorting domain-containing protein [Cytophagales bacterium]